MRKLDREFRLLLLGSALPLALASCDRNVPEATTEETNVTEVAETAPAESLPAETVQLPAGTPDLSGYWMGAIAQFLPPPEGPGPIQDIKGNPWPNINEPYEADTSNSILQPWVRERLEQQNVLETTNRHVSTPQETCSPYGVPWVYTLSANVQFLQHPDLVVILYQRGQQYRVIHMGEEHPQDLEPDWYGHSVGHYEGDTLIVDTIGFNDKTWIDQFGTPHTDQLHVVERFRIVEGPNGEELLQIHFTVEDPGAFMMPWSAIVNYRRSNGAYMEEICGENNRQFLDAMTPAY